VTGRRPGRPDRRPLGHPGLVPERSRRRRPMDCIEFVERVTEYLEDALDAADRARIDAHLEICADCARVLDQWRRTVDLVGHLGAEAADELDAATRAKLLAAFRDEPPPP